MTWRERSVWQYGEDTGWWHAGWVEIGAMGLVRESFCPSSPVEQEERNWQSHLFLPPPPPFFYFFSLYWSWMPDSPEDLSLYVIKRCIGGERKNGREIETGTERETDMQDRGKLEEEMLGGWKKEKINVSSLLQIRRRLKSRHNP